MNLTKGLKVAFHKVQPINHWSGGAQMVSWCLMCCSSISLRHSTMQHEMLKAERDQDILPPLRASGTVTEWIRAIIFAAAISCWDSEIPCNKVNVGEGIFKLLFVQTLAGVSWLQYLTDMAVWIIYHNIMKSLESEALSLHKAIRPFRGLELFVDQGSLCHPPFLINYSWVPILIRIRHPWHSGIVLCGWAEILLAQFTAAADVLGFRIKVRPVRIRGSKESFDVQKWCIKLMHDVFACSV